MAKERLTLIFSPENYAKPITYRLIKDFDLKLNILKAEITPGEEGRLLADLEGEEASLSQALAFLQAESVAYIPANRQLSLKHQDCIHCGACTAVCFSGALAIDRTDWQVKFEPEQCLVCGLCIEACPLRLIQIGFGTSLYEK